MKSTVSLKNFPGLENHGKSSYIAPVTRALRVRLDWEPGHHRVEAWQKVVFRRKWEKMESVVTNDDHFFRQTQVM